MTAFTLRGTNALVAASLSLTLALPGMSIAQTPLAPLAAPSAETAVEAQAWQPVSRFGLSFEIPPGAVVTDDIDGPDLSAYAVSSMGNGTRGTRLGLRLLTPLDMIDAPAPGSPEFAGFLLEMGQVPVAATGAVLDLGGRQMLVYAGHGMVPAPGGATHEAQMLILVSQAPDAEGNYLLIAVFSAGLGAGVAGELEARFVTSLRPVEDESETEDAADTDDTTSTDDDAGTDDDGDTPDAAGTEPPADHASAEDGTLPAAETDDAVSASEPESPAPGLNGVTGNGVPGDVPAETAVDAAFAALDVAIADPAGNVPEGWERYERFGYAVALPQGAGIAFDAAAEFSARWQDGEAGAEIEVGLLLASPGMIEALPAAPGTPGFLDILSDWAQSEVRDSRRSVMLGERPMRLYLAVGGFGGGVSGDGFSGDVPEAPQVRGVYLVAEAPDDEGNMLIAAALHRIPAATGEARPETIARVTGSLGLAPPRADDPVPEFPEADAPGSALAEPGISAIEVPGPEVADVAEAGPPAAVSATDPEGKDPATEVPGLAPAPVQTPSTASPEARAWQEAQTRQTEAAMLAYLAEFPRGLHSGEARRWLRARDVIPPDERRPAPVQAPVQAPADPDAEAWAQALAEGTAQAFWTYLKARPDGAHVSEAFALLSFLPRPGTQQSDPAPAPMPGRPDPRPNLK